MTLVIFFASLVSARCNRDFNVEHEGVEYTVVRECKRTYSQANEDCKNQAPAGKRGQLAILDTQTKINVLPVSFWYVLNKARQDHILFQKDQNFCT